MLLVDHDADVNARNEDLRTPLHLASWNGRFAIVRLLLERGADIHERDIDGRTPYALASRSGEHDIMRLLLGMTGAEG
jgi:ankyrin repeat protein